MVDTVRTTASLATLLADNTSGDISAQDARDFLVSVAYATDWDVFAGHAYTTSDSPNASYVGKSITNGVITSGNLLTAPNILVPAAASFIYSEQTVMAWQAGDITGTTLYLTFDFGASVVAELNRAILTGLLYISQGVYHTPVVALDYSSNGSSWTAFGASPLTGMPTTPTSTYSTGQVYSCIFTDDATAARYWRFSVDQTPDWLMLHKMQGFGRLI